MSKIQELIDLLSAERVPVSRIWHELGITRSELGELIRANRDQLGREGIMLHVATVSQASAPRLHIETDGQRVASLSRPAGRASAIGRYINEYLSNMGATASELGEIKTNVDARYAQAQQTEQAQAGGEQAEQADHMTYREEFVRCGKPTCKKCEGHGEGHGPYWYGYYRQNGKLKKKYIGKTRPTAA